MFHKNALLSTGIFLFLLVFCGTAYSQTYTTIANGNWTAGATWMGGSIPPTAGDIPTTAVINIRHTVAYDTGNPIKLRGELRIQPIAGTTATLNVPGNINFETFVTGATQGRFIVINGTYRQCRFTTCNDGEPYSGNNPGAPIQSGTIKNIGGYQEIRNSTIEIAQDWTNEAGGDRIIEDTCLKMGQNFSISGTGSTDIIRRTLVSMGWHASGNYQLNDGTSTYDQARFQLAGTSGNFSLNSGTVSGDIDYIAHRNHIVPFTGSGNTFASTSVTGTVNLDAHCEEQPSDYIPNGKFTGPQVPNSCSVDFSCLGPVFVNVSGTVFNDVNGLTDSTVNGTGIGSPSGTQLYANLISGTTVVATVPINADGTYLHTGVAPGTYTVQVSTVQGVVGNPIPATTLPAGWVNTGENLGTGIGNDGTVNGLLPITVGTTNVVNANFGIEQRPVPNDTISPSQQNPGGTTNVTVSPTMFSANDPDGGTISNIRITAFPSNATTITINGVTFTSTSFPAGGVIVPTNAAGNPTQPITVDPIDGSVTVGIPYRAIDNAGVESTVTATASLPFTLSLSGNVFNDVNGLTDGTVNGPGTNAGGPLYANLLNAAGNVVQTMLIPPSGVYSFAGLNTGAYTVQVSTNQGTVGNPMPVTALPAGWVNTGENVGTGVGNDGLVNGLLPVTLGTTNVANANFGINQRPTANNNTAAGQQNPGGTANATVPATTFSGTDAAPGTISSIIITAFPSNATSITINGITYTAANFPANGVTVPTNASGNPTQPITVDPIDGIVTVVIPYVTVDNAGVQSAPATASVPFTLSVSGNVFNDVNGLTDGTVNGAGTNAGGPLYANLLNSAGTVVQTVLIPAGGAYSFTGISATGNYSVQVSTNQGTVGNPAPATTPPAGWVYTGENVGTGIGNDGLVNGLLPVTVGTTNVANANFGINQRPTPISSTLPSQTNPPGTTNVTVPATAFSATDPAPGIVSSIRITAFPSNATSITINGITYTSTTFPVGGVTVPTNASGNPLQPITIDPINGTVTVVIPFVAIDNAGVESSTTGTVSMPFTAPTAAAVEISGRVFDDRGRGVPRARVLLTDPDGNVRSAITNPFGYYRFTEVESGMTYVIQVNHKRFSYDPMVINVVENISDLNFVPQP